MFAGGIMKHPDSFYPDLYLILELYSPDLVGVGIIVIFPSVLFNCFVLTVPYMLTIVSNVVAITCLL